MLALIVVVCVAAITVIGSNVNDTFAGIELNKAVNGTD